MDFFNHQDRARHSTRKLILLFCCAVAVLILMTSLLVYAVLFYAEGSEAGQALDYEVLTSDIFIKVGLGVVGVIILGTLYRLAQLRGGGKRVAESMNGRLLNLNTRDQDERKMLNVVEEMAIAAGLPVPPVYLIEDPAINAFAAGYHQQDAVIGVTRGCIQQLSREELQGVIAHEFSHIFNGDMRLNIRLIGILYGVMVIGMIGYYLMRSSVYRSGRNRKGGGIIFLGLGLVVIGYGGTFFGNLIKAAVSRQREFLADASAVQFTRNPGGISGALKKIGGYREGSEIHSVDVSEISHMLFEEGVTTRFSGLFATHPPLPERIRRIDRSWKGGYSDPVPTKEAESAAPGTASFSQSTGGGSAVEAIGNPGIEHIEQAERTISLIPTGLREDVHSSFGATIAMYALLIDPADGVLAQKQLALLRSALDERNYQQLQRMLEIVQALPRKLQLPLVDMALPGLKELSPMQYRTFMSLLSQLMVVDEAISLFEWCLFKILRHNLDPSSRRRGKPVDIDEVDEECEILLSALAIAGQNEQQEMETAFDQAAIFLNKTDKMSFRCESGVDIKMLDGAMDTLNDLKPLQKPLLLKAMVTCIHADGIVMAEEAELLRAVGSLLDCPIPPLLDNQKFI